MPGGRYRRSTLLWVLLVLPSVAGAEPPAPVPAEDPSELELFHLENSLNRRVETVSRLREPVDRAPGITTVWTREEILTTGARTLQDVLKLLPGFDTFDYPDEGRHL